MKKQTKNKRFIPLEKINLTTARTQFKYKRKPLRIAGAFGLMGLSFIIPDLGIGLVLGVMLLSPIKLRYSLRNVKEDIKFKINKRLILWGLK